MKKLILIGMLLIAASQLYAQESELNLKTDIGPKNSLKFMPVNLLFNSYSFEFERMISPKNSLTLGVGIPSNRSFADKIYFDTGDADVSKDEFGIFALRLAYRHYSHKRPTPSGFYISPSLKYQKINLSGQLDRTTDLNEHYTENVNMKASTYSLGFQLGYQVLIAKMVTIDFCILGIEAGLGNIDADLKSTDPDFIDEVDNNAQDLIDDLPSFLGDKITKTRVSDNAINLKGKSIPFPWYRGGINIGIAF